MAKAKQMETEIVEAEAKEVDFGELELKISKPSLNSDKTLSVNGNFTELGTNIKALVEKYKNTQLTDENVKYVKTLKGQFVSLRTGIDRERKEWKKVYLDPAENLIKSMCDELLAIVAEGENALKIQLEAYDQKRKDELTIILKEYVADSVVKHNLRTEYAEQIQLKDKYYNLTQNEEDSADDIELQACELEKKQKEYDSGVALITAECEDAGFLSDTYIRQLQYKSAMEIILEIKADKKAKAELKAQAEDTGKVVIGADNDSEIAQQMAKATSFEDEETRERTLYIKYKPSQAKLIAQFFKTNGIDYKFL